MAHPRTRFLAYFLLSGLIWVLFSGAGFCDETDVARAMLEWREDWPGTYIQVPVEVFRAYARSLLGAEPEPEPSAPVDFILARAEYTAHIDGEMLQLTVREDVLVLNPNPQPIPLLASDLPWEQVTVNGTEAALRQEGRWLHLDNAGAVAAGQAPPGDRMARLTLSARADLRGRRVGGTYRTSVPTAPATLSLLKVDSPQAWEVHTSRAALPIVGGEQDGTHGAVGLVRGSGDDAPLEIVWQPPQPPVTRPGQPVYESYLAWHLGEGAQEVHACLDVRIVGGERDSIVIQFPAGADRVQITGPDVREFRAVGRSATVHLKGEITGATQLSVRFAIPWLTDRGRTNLTGFGIQGGRLRGGALVISSGVDGVVLQEEARGLAELEPWRVPPEAASLSVGPPLLAYAFTGADWQAGVDVVSVSELPVRETLIDEASYTVLLCPDGMTMHKVGFRVRNRNRQFLKLGLPESAGRLVLARVSEQPVVVSRTPDGELLIPLDKSVETIAGAVSFPVEIVFLSRTAPLDREGRLRLALARADIPSAQAHCTVFVPRGFRTQRWEGAFRLSQELTAAAEQMQYGRGYVEPGPPGEPALGDEERARLLSASYFSALTSAYEESDFDRAAAAARKVIEVAPESAQATEAQKLLGNIAVLKGERREGGRAERVIAQRLETALETKSESILAQQQELIRRGRQKVREGDEEAAAEAFKAAEEIGLNLAFSEKDKGRQEALLEESRKWLGSYEEEREETIALRKKIQAARVPAPALGERPEAGAGKPIADSGERALPVAPVSGPAPAMSALLEDVARIRTRAPGEAGRPSDREEEAENVQAAGRIAVQRATGKGQLMASGKSLAAERARLQEEIKALEAGQGTLGGLAPTDQPVSIIDSLEVVEDVARELVVQKRYAEATQVLEKAKLVLGEGIRTVDELDSYTGFKSRLSDIGQEVAEESRQARVRAYDVTDVVDTEGQGKALAEFLARNYAVTGKGGAGQDALAGGFEVGGRSGISYQDGTIVVADINGDGVVEAGDGVFEALENLRQNLRQKVVLNTRGIALSERAATSLGIRWNDMADGRWAVADEGQLRALLALEQRARAPQQTVSKGQREVVPGTAVALDNDARVKLNLARDASNTFMVGDAPVELPHEQVLLVSNEWGLVAMRAGGTQYWTEAPEAPEIEEVPMEIDVPAVGVPVRFEKVLVRPEDELVIECSYTYEEAEDE